MASAALEVLADAAAVADRVARLLLEAALQAPGAPLGLATGRTMVPVYQRLVALIAGLPAEQCQRLLENWCSFNLDEYVGLGPADAQSFAAEMARVLVDPLGLSPHRLNLPNGMAGDPHAEAVRYGAAVQEAGGIGLQLLGLGSNGHVGFNEPPCAADAPCRCVQLSWATRVQNAAAFGGEPAAVPRQAITLGTSEILQARAVLLVVTGAEKAQILRRALLESPCEQVPASWLQHHPQLRVIVDAGAAAALKPT